MKHSNAPKLCPGCEEKLKGVHHALAAVFRDVIKPRFRSCHISDGWRGEEEQNKAFEEGKSLLKWPNSAHNKLDDQGNPCSLAIDLFELEGNGLGYWRWKYFEAIGGVLKNLGVPVMWGGYWKDFKDGPHFEWAGPV